MNLCGPNRNSTRNSSLRSTRGPSHCAGAREGPFSRLTAEGGGRTAKAPCRALSSCLCRPLLNATNGNEPFECRRSNDGLFSLPPSAGAGIASADRAHFQSAEYVCVIPVRWIHYGPSLWNMFDFKKPARLY